MERIGLHQMFMNIAFEVSKRSTCARVNVGALIVKNQRIISMGWNGSPAGKEHCSDYFYERFQQERDNYSSSITYSLWKDLKEFKDEHHEFAVENEIHGEMNAILFAAKNGISIEGSDLYVTWSPCIDCSKSLLQVGIKNVYYHNLYDREPIGIEFLEKNGIKCFKIDGEEVKRYE